jgi:antitoxin (DNA-binding transcriptional repressor) of toxin-antitoxin stability system
MKVSISDLPYWTKEVLKAVERGETVAVFHGGKEKARLVPALLSPAGAKIRANKAFGMWKHSKDLRNVAKCVRALRQRRFT